MYSGWLLKIGNYTMPLDLINIESYSAYVNMQDLNPWYDGNGYEHRNAVDLKALKVELETRNMLTNKEFSKLMSKINENLTIPKARQCMVTAYIPEYDDYVTQIGYLSDFQPQMYQANEKEIKYNPIRMAFIGGVYDG